MTPFIRLHPADDVLIARAQLIGGMTVDMLKSVNDAYSREPNNALAQALYAKYISGKGIRVY